MQTMNVQEDFMKKTDQEKILYIDKDLIEFLIKAQQQGLNCLDLSKRNIQEFPNQILEFTSLQYLYLEGNQLTQLPSNLFVCLSHLKWLDLRNNRLTFIPNEGLLEHRFLQYLLLSGNCLRSLPFELGKVKTLSALNLDGNPLIHPPFEIIKQGIKFIQQYLRERLSSNDSSSDNEDHPTPRYTPNYSSIVRQKSNSESGFYQNSQTNILPAHLQSCIQYKRMSYSPGRPSTSMRSRPQSEMRLPQVKTRHDLKKSNEQETDVCVSQEPSLIHMKHRSNKKLDENHSDFHQKTFLTSQIFEEPMIQTPYHIDPDYLQMINKTPSKKIIFDKRRTPVTEDEKRKHDRQIQERIRQITDQMLRRRLEARSSLFEEKRQVRMELREIRRLEADATKQARIKSSNKKS